MAAKQGLLNDPRACGTAGRLAVLALLACLFSGHAAADRDVCIACHEADGMGYGNFSIPIIAGTPPVHIEEALYAYKDGARQCPHAPLMCQAVGELNDDEIAALADYFGTQPRGSSDQEYDVTKALKGEHLHNRYCQGCHVPPNDPAVADALGIPLHGQRRWYLRYALDAYSDGSRENLLPAMAAKLAMLQDGDIEALTDYYASFSESVQD